MQMHATKPLFLWDELEVSPKLANLRLVVGSIPAAPLLDALLLRRHIGCDT